MIAAGLPFPGEREAAAEPEAPMLPVEGHAVAAALAMHGCRAKADLLLVFMQQAPRADADIFAAFTAAQERLNAAWAAYSNLREIRDCRRSA